MSYLEKKARLARAVARLKGVRQAGAGAAKVIPGARTQSAVSKLRDTRAGLHSPAFSSVGGLPPVGRQTLGGTAVQRPIGSWGSNVPAGHAMIIPPALNESMRHSSNLRQAAKVTNARHAAIKDRLANPGRFEGRWKQYPQGRSLADVTMLPPDMM